MLISFAQFLSYEYLFVYVYVLWQLSFIKTLTAKRWRRTDPENFATIKYVVYPRTNIYEMSFVMLMMYIIDSDAEA